MAWDWRNKDALRRKCPDAGNGLGGRLVQMSDVMQEMVMYVEDLQGQETAWAADCVKRLEEKNDSSSMIFLDGEAGCRHKMLLTHKKIWTFFPIRAKYLPAFQHQPLNGRVAQW